MSGADKNATFGARTGAITNFAGNTERALYYPSVFNKQGVNEAFILPMDSDEGEACWIPAGSKQDIEFVLDNIIIDRALVTQKRVVPIAFEAVRDLEAARRSYTDSISIIRENWLAAGGKIDEQIAKSIRDARMSMRKAIRARHPVSGFSAKVLFDIPRYGSTANYEKVIIQKTDALLKEGRAEEVISKAVSTNKLANKFGKLAAVTLPLAKAISVTSTIAVAIEIPYRYYELDIAKTDKERNTALIKMSEATATGAIAAACLVFGVSTGGVAFLACGVAPVVAGVMAGKAAEYVLSNMTID
ncbi:MAG: hypothetical protein JWR68_2757 [Polaromonas sp.]|nr:hypothetical protein [Polaromonas sp.]